MGNPPATDGAADRLMVALMGRCPWDVADPMSKSVGLGYLFAWAKYSALAPILIVMLLRSLRMSWPTQ